MLGEELGELHQVASRGSSAELYGRLRKLMIFSVQSINKSLIKAVYWSVAYAYMTEILAVVGLR